MSRLSLVVVANQGVIQVRTFAVGCAVLLAGCASEPTDPSPNLATQTRTRETQEFVSDIVYLNDCAGEPVAITFRERVAAHELVYADGRDRLQLTIHEAGSTALGLESGREWKAVGNQKISFLVEPEPSVDGLLVSTVTGHVTTQLTLAGPEPMHLTLLFAYQERQLYDPATGSFDSTPLKERFRLRVLHCQ
jgi:hypothetical protein